MARPGGYGGGTRPRRPPLVNRVRPHLQAPLPQAPMPGAPPGAPAEQPAVDPYDYSADPILQQIRALGTQRVADAQAEAIRLRAQEAADWTDTQAQLGREQVERPRALTENLNRSNLFYSSEYGKQQSGLARQLAEDAAGAQRAHLGRLSGIESGLTETQRAAAEQGIGAEGEAAQRMRDRLGDLPLGGGPAHGTASRPAPRLNASPLAGALAGHVRARLAPRPRARRPLGGMGGI